MNLNEAAERAARVRGLYNELEERHEGARWESKDDMLGLVNDVGALARLVMAAGGQWVPEGDVAQQLRAKLADCLWWILVLAGRMEIDIDETYDQTMNRIEEHLVQSIRERGAG